MANSGNLMKRAIWHVARNIARGHLSSDHSDLDLNERQRRWNEKTEEARPEAIEKINSMTNVELLDLIEEMLDDA